jgi:hypothetical protein
MYPEMALKDPCLAGFCPCGNDQWITVQNSLFCTGCNWIWDGVMRDELNEGESIPAPEKEGAVYAVR